MEMELKSIGPLTIVQGAGVDTPTESLRLLLDGGLQ